MAAVVRTLSHSGAEELCRAIGHEAVAASALPSDFHERYMEALDR